MGIKRHCTVTGREFEVSENFQFLLKRIGEMAPVLEGVELPVPDVHPWECARRVAAFGNHRFLSKTKSAVSGASVITRFDPTLGTKVCSEEEFFNSVDNTSVGRDYDFSRGFFEQWHEVFLDSIHHPRNATNCEDSDYVNGAANLKSCYLCFAAFDSRNCLYCWLINACEDCIDLHHGIGCELCFRSIDLTRCYNVRESASCNDSQNLFGCLGCDSCADCFGCVGLHRAQYAIFNTTVNREEYFQFLSTQNLSSYRRSAESLARCHEHWRAQAFRPKFILNSSESSGAYIERCEEVEQCWNCRDCRQCGYLVDGNNCTSSYCGVSKGGDLNFLGVFLASSVSAYCYTTFNGRNNFYSAYLHGGASDCFGCASLHRKQYCVLNKEHSKGEYERLVPRIIRSMKERGEWGSWFPLEYSPHYYNESCVDQYFRPLSSSEVSRRGYLLKVETDQVMPTRIVRASELPDVIREDDIDSLVENAVLCESTNRAFNLQRNEIAMYFKHGLPLPREHWKQRMVAAISARDLPEPV